MSAAKSKSKPTPVKSIKAYYLFRDSGGIGVKELSIQDGTVVKELTVSETDLKAITLSKLGFIAVAALDKGDSHE